MLAALVHCSFIHNHTKAPPDEAVSTEVLHRPEAPNAVAMKRSDSIEHTAGMIKKPHSAAPRFGLRFRTMQQLRGRHHSLSVGNVGLVRMMGKLGWAVHDVAIFDAQHAIVEVDGCPAHNKVALKRADGQRTAVLIKAVNAAAKKAFKERGVAYQIAVDDGDDGHSRGFHEHLNA